MIVAKHSNRLSVLAADIQAAHATITQTAAEMAERAVAAGHMLIEAKAALPHGQWDRWLRDYAGLSARTARRYMQLARSGLESATVADLGIRAATERLARATSRPVADLDSNPDYLAWAAEMNAGLNAAPTPTARERMLQLMREQVAAEQFAAWLRDRAGPDKLEQVAGWVERTDAKLVAKMVKTALAKREARP